MGCSVLAIVQDSLIKQILHDRVGATSAVADAEEHDLLALGSGGWYPIGQVIEYCCVAFTIGIEGDPQHDVVWVGSC